MYNLIGKGYDQSTESDILLLDISNNDEYIWTNDFDLSPPSSTPMNQTNSTYSPTPTSTSTQQPDDNKPALIGAIVGSLLGGALLSLGGLLLYKWNKKRQISDNNDYRRNTYDDYEQEISQVIRQPPRNEYATPAPVIISRNYNNGQPYKKFFP